MASPQCEDGYTRIANELFEAIIRADLSARQMKIILALIRKTYGFGRKSDHISCSQFAQLTGISRHHCNSLLNQLFKMNIISKTVPATGNSLTVSWGLQKDYSTWLVFPMTGTVPKKRLGVPREGNKSVPCEGTHKRKKETITKEIRDPLDEISPVAKNDSKSNGKKEWLKYLKTTQDDPPKYPNGFLYWLTKTKKIREIDFVSIEYDRRKNIIRQYVEEYF